MFRLLSALMLLIYSFYAFSYDEPCAALTNQKSVSIDISEVISNAKQGDSDNQFVLGRLYEQGVCVEKDISKALEWYKSAATQGNGGAAYNAALIYISSDHLNEQEARKYFKIASEANHKEAMFNLAVMYEAGKGGEKNIRESISLYSKSADLGYDRAHEALGLLYLIDDSTYHNKDMAIKHLKIAADHGFPEAQYQMGRFYFLGDGVEENTRKAIELMVSSARQGNQNAIGFLDYLKKSANK